VETLSVEGRQIGDVVLLRIEKRAVFLGLNLFELVESAQRELRESSGDCQVPFDSWIGASRSGKGLLFQIDNREVWLPASEITVNEGLKTVGIPRWLALDKELPLSKADAEDEPSELRLEFVKDLVDCLAADMAKDGGFNSALVLEKRQDKAMLRMNLKRDFGHVKGPIIALNAYMDAGLLSSLTGREVQSWSVPIKMVGTEVTQFSDGYFGKVTLMDKGGQPKSSARRILQGVKTITEGQAEKVLIVTWKKLAEYLIGEQKNGRMDQDIAVAWFGGIEGVNQYESREVAIIIGTPSVPADDLVEMAHALWASDPETLDTRQHHAWRQYPYCDADGNGMEVQVREFIDPRLNLLMKHFRQHEILQAVHRIRPVRHHNRKVYLFTNLPLEQLPPTQLTNLGVLIGGSDGYQAIQPLIGMVLDQVSGIWADGLFKLLQSLKAGGIDQQAKKAETQSWPSRVISVINYIYNNNVDPTALSLDFSLSTIKRWLNKYVEHYQLHFVRLKIGDGPPLIVYHRPDQLAEDQVRSLHQALRDLQGEEDLLEEEVLSDGSRNSTY